MKIAILGWGSLTWDPRDLSVVGEWQKGGPELPIEFSRISSDRRSTLVIDCDNGVPVPTKFAQSREETLEEAIDDLRRRERTEINNVGFVDLQNHRRRCRVSKVGDFIHGWAATKGFGAVVWTDLSPNFLKRTGRPFSTDRAVSYLSGLPEEAKSRAREYLERAPEDVETPLRFRLREVGWLPATESGRPEYLD